MELARATPGDGGAAHRLLGNAATQARELGMHQLQADAAALAEREARPGRRARRATLSHQLNMRPS